MSELELRPAKRRKLEEDQQAKDTLVNSLETLSEAVNSTVVEARREYDAREVEQFVRGPSGRGVRKFWSHVTSYVECLRANGVSTYAELEGVWRRQYGCSEVRDAVESLLEAEDGHQTFLKQIEKQFVETQESSAPIQQLLATGEEIPKEVKLIEASSGEARELRYYWESSKFTLFVLLRHFG